MTDEQALLAAICTYPDEDTPRLVYADWLDERGGHDDLRRSQLIRRQIEFSGDQLDIWEVMCQSMGWFDIALAAAHRTYHDWEVNSGGAATFRSSRSDGEVVVARGFVSSLTCTWQSWLEHAPQLFWIPRQRVRCEACYGSNDHGHAGHANWNMRDCPVCSGSGTIPRPFPGVGVQPLRNVVLTDSPRWWRDQGAAIIEGLPTLPLVEDEHDTLDSLFAKACDAKWPGLEFELPTP